MFRFLIVVYSLREDPEGNMNVKLRILVFTCVALFLSACGSSPQDLIVGRWEVVSAKADGSDAPYTQVARAIHMTAEFHADGTASMTMMRQTLQGTYKFNGDDLEWAMSGITTKARAKVTATELAVTDNANRTVLYKRR
jgi:hypothetical protein